MNGHTEDTGHKTKAKVRKLGDKYVRGRWGVRLERGEERVSSMHVMP